MVALILAVLVHRRRAGAHQRHIAPQHIEELGQFVDAGTADEAPHAGDAGIVLHLEHQAVHLVPGHQVLFARFGVGVHAAQLVDIEVPAVQAHALLAEDQRAGAFQLEGDRHDGDDGNTDQAAHQRAENIHHPLEDHVPQFQFDGAHGDDVAAGAAAQFPAQAGRTGIIAADLLDAVQQFQAEMHGQAHAFHLLQIRQEGLAAVHRDVHIDLVQRRAPDPVHKIIEGRAHGHTLHFLPHGVLGRVQQGHAAKAFGPIVVQRPDHRRGVVHGGKDAHQILHAALVAGVQQIAFEQRVGKHHQRRVDQRHRHRKIAGIEHFRLSQQHQRGIDRRHQDIEARGQPAFPPQTAGDNVLPLVEEEEGDKEGDHHQAEGLDPVADTVGNDASQQPVGDQPRRQHTDGQRHQVEHEYISVLQFFAFIDHSYFLFLHRGAPAAVFSMSFIVPCSAVFFNLYSAGVFYRRHNAVPYRRLSPCAAPLLTSFLSCGMILHDI